jgi:signal transduction histidine kinase
MEIALGRLRSRWVTLDCVAAVLMAAVYSGLFHELAQLADVPRAVAAVLAACSVLPAAGRRLWPRTVLGVVVVASAATMTLSHSPVLPFSVAFVMYLVPLRFARREALWLLGGALAALGLGLAGFAAVSHGIWGPGGAGAAISLLAQSWVLVAGSWMIGYTVRQQRAYAAGLHAQAERAAQAAARELVAESRRQAGQERAQIARELHDVVAHSLSLIAVQAGVANWVVSSQPEEAARALSSIEEISRGALREMRALLGVLRVEPDSGVADSTAAGSTAAGSTAAGSTAAGSTVLEPAPGLADLDELAARISAAGVRVHVEVCGAQTALLPGLDLAAYRVIQEAVTNVVKHAGAASCQVSVRYSPAELVVEVTDDGCRVPSAGRPAGHGIVGMRERVEMYGGEFRAAPQPGGGFGVSARFPMTSAGLEAAGLEAAGLETPR